MTQADRVRSVLLGAPSTSFEVSVCADLSRQVAAAYLDQMRERGEIEAVGEIQTERRPAQLWALTPRGKTKTRHLREWDEIDAEREKGQAA